MTRLQSAPDQSPEGPRTANARPRTEPLERAVNISVCMATYNGEAYVVRQVTSILEQLTPTDEIVVVDDCSTDRTVETILRIGDPRISIHVNDRNRREVYSFSRAISLARNEIVFMADQDDVWMPGRATLMKQRLLASNAVVLSSNFRWMNALEEPIDVPCDGVSAAQSTKHVRNVADIFIGKTNYFGCAMAFRREFVPVIAPIPAFVESHDLWIALASNLARANIHLDEPTLLKRKHGNNATSTVSTRSLYRKLRSRVIFALSLVVLLNRVKSTPARGPLPLAGKR
jgi:glycosyltransferase involved in cell wall biosynthesis